ncbi:MAG: phenylalanine--tRNA ligase subunit beta, partial [Lysobacterales bacterium]
TALLLEIAGGEAGPLIHAVDEQHIPDQNTVVLRHARLNRVLGVDLPRRGVEKILADLRLQPEFGDGAWTVTAPSDRFDIAIEEDLIEEVARIFGYENIPLALPSGELNPAVVSETRVPLESLQQTLCASGYQEVINYSFTNRALLARFSMDQHVLPLANALNADFEVMRTSLLPGLMENLARNLRRQQDRVRLFETGNVFRQRKVLAESLNLAAVACGSQLPEQWGAPSRGADFFDLKGDIELLSSLRGSNRKVAFREARLTWLHPGQAALINMDGEDIGWAGSIHPSILRQMDIRGPVLAFELDLDKFSNREIPYAKEISHFPSVRRDLALLVPENVSYTDLRQEVVDLSGELLTNLILFDLYSGQNVERGYKSLAIGLILQNVSCTLTDEVVDALVRKVVQGLADRLKVQLRG